uniref:DNA-directed DNA polymerase n=1 Tax=Ochromonas danica TaxID=2986 RepID=Q9G910_OCHDN|nr:DNA polymerase [Ochromonas danica]AAG18395.1 DNA polymerase [Ochromonas danica]
MSQLKNNFNNIFFCNFECLFFNNKHYIVCFTIMPLLKTTPHIFKSDILLNSQLTDIDSISLDLLEFFIKSIFELSKSKTNYFIFHNLKRFDFFYILSILSNTYKVDIIIKNDIIYSVCIIFGDKKIFFRDSFLLFPDSICFFYDSFLSKRQKFISISFFFKLNLLKNCEQDTFFLCKAFNSYMLLFYNEFKINILNSLTFSSLSLYIFINKFYNATLYSVLPLKKSAEIFIRKAYFGGSCDLFSSFLPYGFHYDANSLYPYVMKYFDMPIGNFEIVSIDADFDINTFFGFIEIEANLPKDIKIPFLSLLNKSVFFSEEVKYALTLGYNIKFKKAYKFDKGCPFVDFVDFFYLRRFFFKKKKNPLNKIFKLILNSLYGKLGMHTDFDIMQIVHKSKTLDINKILSMHNVKTFEYISEDFILAIYSKEISLEKLYFLSDKDSNNLSKNLNAKFYNTTKFNNSVHFSCSIASYARIEIYKYKLLFYKSLFYSDTDSLFLDKEIPSIFFSNTILGAMKLEEVVYDCNFFSPKNYSYYNSFSTDIRIIKGKSNI